MIIFLLKVGGFCPFPCVEMFLIAHVLTDFVYAVGAQVQFFTTSACPWINFRDLLPTPRIYRSVEDGCL